MEKQTNQIKPYPGLKMFRPQEPEEYIVVVRVDDDVIQFAMFNQGEFVCMETIIPNHWSIISERYSRRDPGIIYPSEYSKDNPMPEGQLAFINGFGWMSEQAHNNSRAKGFWGPTLKYDVIQQLAATSLIVEEIGELNTALRKDERLADFVGKAGLESVADRFRPALTNAAEEMADTVIRMMDLAERMGVDLANAIAFKMKYNESRPYKHGKKA